MDHTISSSKRLIVTHQNPDFDAVTSVWLLKRFLPGIWAEAEVAFVAAGKILPEDKVKEFGITDPENMVHVDTGLGKFDHHQAERGKLRICAASLVFDFISEQQKDKKQNKALKVIVEHAIELDHFEDCYWPEAGSFRYDFMLPALLAGARETGSYDDSRILQFGFEMLDAAYAVLRNEVKADEIIQKEGQTFTIVIDGKKINAIALASSNGMVEKRAQKMGFELMLRKDEANGNARIKATPKSNIDLTSVYEEILKIDTIGDWYLHPSTRMLLNGSSKSKQNPTPLSLTKLVTLVKNIFT